jgi:hypothetical protein
MAIFHAVSKFIHYYNVGCQALSHDRRFKEFSFLKPKCFFGFPSILQVTFLTRVRVNGDIFAFSLKDPARQNIN